MFSGKYYELIADLDLADIEWTPIGTIRFSTFFDGKNHTIKGLAIHSDENNIGLFGYVSSESYIKNLKVTDAYVSGNSWVGGVVGTMNEYWKIAISPVVLKASLAILVELWDNRQMVLLPAAVTAVPYQVLIVLLFAEELLAGYRQAVFSIARTGEHWTLFPHQAELQEWPVELSVMER